MALVVQRLVAPGRDGLRRWRRSEVEVHGVAAQERSESPNAPGRQLAGGGLQLRSHRNTFSSP
eukprot:3639881-Prymnesium_polylepis.1